METANGDTDLVVAVKAGNGNRVIAEREFRIALASTGFRARTACMECRDWTPERQDDPSRSG
jgi:hypothetical protein